MVRSAWKASVGRLPGMYKLLILLPLIPIACSLIQRPCPEPVINKYPVIPGFQFCGESEEILVYAQECLAPNTVAPGTKVVLVAKRYARTQDEIRVEE